MLANNIQFRPVGRAQATNEPLFKTEALKFLANFRQKEEVFVNLRLENIGPQEPAYLVTEFADGTFKIYSVEIPRVNSNKVALTDDERDAILDAIPADETYVALERGFNFDIKDDESEITVLLGEDWLFTVLVDTETETYMIERNEYLLRDSDISPMVRAVGVAFREARDQ